MVQICIQYEVLSYVCHFCSIIDGQLKPVDGELSKSLLENNNCYLLDCGAEIYVWVGRVTQVEDRKAASQAAEVKCSI